MTSLHLLVAYLRHAELCALGRKCVVRQDQVRAYPKHLAGFLVILLHSWVTNCSHRCSHQDDPLIQSP